MHTKRVFACLLALILLFGLTACKQESVYQYCYSCGKGVSKTDEKCPSCGALVRHINDGDAAQNDEAIRTTTTTSVTTMPTETTTATTTTTTTTTAKTKKTTTGHVHEFYATQTWGPTCTERGYTEHFCECGYVYCDAFTEPTHQYNGNQCELCHRVNPEKLSEFIFQWLKENGGQENGNYVAVIEWDTITGKLGCSSNGYNIYFETIQMDDNGNSISTYLRFSDSFFSVYQRNDGDIYEVSGILRPRDYTFDWTPEDASWAPGSQTDAFLQVTQQSVRELLRHMYFFLQSEDFGVYMEDFGFQYY